MKSNSSLRRVGFSFGAQIYSQIVNIGVQIMLVPILLHAWGAQAYAVWLLLSAVPTYLMFSDFGFTLSAKNEMTIKARQRHYLSVPRAFLRGDPRFRAALLRPRRDHQTPSRPGRA
jgi:hypothetical protein